MNIIIKLSKEKRKLCKVLPETQKYTKLYQIGAVTAHRPTTRRPTFGRLTIRRQYNSYL
jgi:hypothetical protein